MELSLVTIIIIAAGFTYVSSDVHIRQFPYQASIFVKGTFRCGGAITNPLGIITAASCLDGDAKDYTVRVGSDNGKDGGVVAQVKKLVKIEGYNEKTGANDVGIVVLTEPLVFSDTVKAILIPKLGRAVAELKGPTIVTGYGTNSSLQVVEPKVLTSKECNEKFKTTLSNDKACGELGGSSKCMITHGDPLVRAGHIIGVATSNYECNPKKPAVFSFFGTLIGKVITAVVVHIGKKIVDKLWNG